MERARGSAWMGLGSSGIGALGEEGLDCTYDDGMKSDEQAERMVVDVKLVRGAVDVGEALGAKLGAECGAEAVFIGRTRAERKAGRGELVALEYEAYEEMAAGTLDAIAREAGKKHGCAYVCVRHSVGRVGVGEASVAVRVGAGHRAQALACCQSVIDELKLRAPIWKREEWSEGAGTWREDAALACAEDGARRREEKRP